MKPTRWATRRSRAPCAIWGLRSTTLSPSRNKSTSDLPGQSGTALPPLTRSDRCQLPTSGEPPLTTAIEPSRSSSLSDGSCPHCGHCREPVSGSQWGPHRGRQGKARQSQHRRDLGVSPATLYRYIPAAGTANSPSVAELNQADRLGVYVGAEIHGDFSPGLQL